MATTRQRLRDAALRLFAERGFRGTTIADVESAAGLAPRAGSFYRHFESKEALLEECLATFADQVFAELSAADFAPLGNTKAELLIIGRAMLDIGTRHRDLRVLLRAEARRDPRLLERVKQVNARFGRETLVPWLVRTLGDDDPADDELSVLCALVFGPVLYYMLEQDIGQRAFALERDTLLEGWADHWARQLDERRAAAASVSAPASPGSG